MAAVAGSCAPPHRLIAYDIEDASVRACAHAIGSRDPAADSAADVRADPTRRYGPCARLHMRAVRICARVDATSSACARCAMVLTCVCASCAFVCVHVCVRACARAGVCARALPRHGADRRYL